MKAIAILTCLFFALHLSAQVDTNHPVKKSYPPRDTTKPFQMNPPDTTRPKQQPGTPLPNNGTPTPPQPPTSPNPNSPMPPHKE